ncbi:tetratricopeptide repeat protein [Variovorax sp. EL159]|uniref:tetratricopeptide repeat protein n=1 Tax=unclassified Variovorax TaxID=663243 RepID=UPI000887529F|nr:SEL1-like repeat protein [Variovorax sp. EL159]SCX60714.1 Sel1 repeat-containing protein [Variovorax sp. EL159]
MQEPTQDDWFLAANDAWDAGAHKKALSLFLKAAAAGEIHALNSVGYFLDHGIGVKKNAAAARDWYRKAAKAGDAAGCANLAICYRDEGNFRWARFWFERAYAQGDGDAALELGRLFLWEGANRNDHKVVHYLGKAAASPSITPNGRKEAQALLKSLGRKQSPSAR